MASSLHIGILAPDFPPQIGGIQTYALEVARGLTRRGHTVTVFTVSQPIDALRGEPFEVRPVLTLRRRTERRLIRETTVDVWHAMNGSYGWVGLDAPRVVVSVHGNDFLQPTFLTARVDLRRRFGLPFGDTFDHRWGRRRTLALLRRGFARVGHVITNSRYTEEVFLQHYPMCRGRTSNGRVGVSDFFFEAVRPPRSAGAPVRLVTACRLSERRKNVDLVLRALGALRDRFAFHYTVVGGGTLQPSLEELSRELGLVDRVTFTGVVSNDQMREQLASADLFVLTAGASAGSHEGFGIVYLEANASGTPTLAAKVAGAAEAVEEGVSGFFAPEATLPAITAALERFFRGEMTFSPQRCRAFADGFRWSAVVDHALACYQRLGHEATTI